MNSLGESHELTGLSRTGARQGGKPLLGSVGAGGAVPMPDPVWSGWGGADLSVTVRPECEETETLTETSKERGSEKDRGAFGKGCWPQNHQKSSVIGVV